MNHQIIPVGERIDHVYVDEPAEFRVLEAATNRRKRREAADGEERLRELDRRQRAERKERRQVLKNCMVLCLGMVATCCAASAVLAWKAAYPVLAVFPAALAMLAVGAGIRMR